MRISGFSTATSCQAMKEAGTPALWAVLGLSDFRVLGLWGLGFSGFGF